MEINAALADAKVNARFAEFGGTALPGSPADFGKLIADETEALADAKVNARFAEFGGTALPGSPADFGKLIADETEKSGRR